MQRDHNVKIGTSWGTLTLQKQRQWNIFTCDVVLRAADMPLGDERSSDFTQQYRQRHAAALASREPARAIQRLDVDSAKGAAHVQAAPRKKLVVAVCACTTSRGINRDRLEGFTLFNLMLPSLLRSLATPDTLKDSIVGVGGAEPLELWVYIAYDVGDQFYDSPGRDAEVRAWLDERLVRPLAGVGVTARHALLRFDNVLRKPGPAFNYMMAAAAQDGADYLYRVNDDTQFVTAWLGDAVRKLRGFSPPNVGVVGPVCHEGKTTILTHDLVHRTHLSIFEHYYPPILSDWWMDDWITHVYGPTRMAKGPWLVRHRVDIHGTRYEVNTQHEGRLGAELDAGKTKLGVWLAAHA